MKDEALNIASQCRATASHDLACNIVVDGGSGLLTELLLDAARIIEALAQPQQEPLGYIASMALNDLRCGIYRDVSVYGEEYEETVPIYTTPPPRKPLTENELFKLWVSTPAETEDRFAFARAIEAAHGIKKNTCGC